MKASLEWESESRSAVSDSLWPHGLYSPWISPGQSTGMGSLSLLQGIFPTQGSNPGLPHCRQILYQLSHHSLRLWSMTKLEKDLTRVRRKFLRVVETPVGGTCWEISWEVTEWLEKKNLEQRSTDFLLYPGMYITCTLLIQKKKKTKTKTYIVLL